MLPHINPLFMRSSTIILSHFCYFFLLIGISGGFFSCNSSSSDTLFRYVKASHSGIQFENTISETEDLNILNFHYIYNGGGVGVGDFNKDGLPDLVFSGNQVTSKLYLNKGNLQFQDITPTSKFNSKGWATGVSVVDINGDGWQDIYLSIGGYECDGDCENQFFIHQGLDENGMPVFKDEAASMGLEDGLYTQQAAFFDYDGDGDLDVYSLHNVIDDRDKNAPSEKRFINPASKDQLYRNDDGKFVNVSEELGINHRGYGLGITINDLNLDGLADIYVANDFLSDDLVYLNKGAINGTHQGFAEVGQKVLKHQSYNSMGVDIADVNQDTNPDIFVLDMLPEAHERQKTMIGFMNYNKFLLTLRQGYAPQFIRNTLQVHNGLLQDTLLPFSEVAQLSDIYQTDWSWTPLLADFDNDGDRDIYVTNGYGKDITDLDFINYSSQMNTFGTPEVKQKRLFETVQAMEEIRMPNYFFENKGHLQFTNQSGNWLPKENSISNGAVYTDLDNDGDLDLVVNNIDEPAYLLENQLNSTETTTANYLKIQLQGQASNPSGIGSKIYLYQNETTQFHYQSPVRGYLSSVDNVVHFGLGDQQIDSLKVIWSDGKIQILKEIAINQTLALQQKNASIAIKKEHSPNTVFQEITPPILSKHQENNHQDFDAQRLLLHQHNRQGPCIISANIDGKIGDEIFISGAKGTPAQLLFPKEDGTYAVQTISDGQSEEVDATFFDADQDNDLDLYIVNGGTEFKPNAPEYQDQLYLNDGKGNFTNASTNLPKMSSSGSVVRACDFDQDGDDDLFIGGRLIPRQYPTSPQSFLLTNDSGKFTNQIKEIAPSLEEIGMVSDAIWVDVDQDSWQDLVVVGEWMPITIFKNKKGKLEKMTFPSLTNTEGLWNCIQTADFDQDGDPDFVIGNLGQNSRLKASVEEPMTICSEDLDKNGSIDPLIGKYYTQFSGQRQSFPLHARDDVVGQVVKVKAQHQRYDEFAKVSFSDLLKSMKTELETKNAYQLASVYVENLREEGFKIHPLPLAAQTAPIQDIQIDDFDQDEQLDILLVGNDYTAEKNGGWYDAFNGLFLKGNGDGTFETIPTSKSGFFVPDDGRSISTYKTTEGEIRILVGQNSSHFKAFSY